MKTQAALEYESSKREVWELIQTLVAGQASANEILELYYWSREPGALDLMRALVALSEEDRKLLAAYFNSVECTEISVTMDGPGKITLSSPEMSNSAIAPRKHHA